MFSSPGIPAVAFAAFMITLIAPTAHALEPAAKCEAGKLKESAKYASCRLKTESKAILKMTTPDFTKCVSKFSDKWSKTEAKAGPDVCPSEGDEASINARITGDVNDLAILLAGGVLSDCSTDLAICSTDLGTCTGDLAICDNGLTICGSDLAICDGSLTTCDNGLASCTSDLSTAQNDLTTCNGNLGACSGDLATCNAGTAAAGNVLSGKTFSSSTGLGVTGTMTNVGQQNVTPSAAAVTITQGYHDGTGQVTGDADLVAANIKSGVNIFGVIGTMTLGLPAQPLKTGQTICYDASGTVIACAGTGQDGELQKGVARSFTDNGNGTITDNVTGLMWEKLSNDGSIHDKDNTYTWTNAFATKVATLNSGNFAGFTDWRVPSSFELFTLVSHGALNPATYSAFNTACPGACTVLTCSCTTAAYYWSSTAYAGNPTFAWSVYFATAAVNGYNKTGNYYVRAVRSGS